MTPPTPEPDDRPGGCVVFDRLVNRVLDGDAAVAELVSDPHPPACRACRQVREGAILLLDGLKRVPRPVPPPGFADRTTRAAARDYRTRRAIRWGERVAAGAIAAGILLAWLASPSAPRPDRDGVAGSGRGGANDPLPVLTPSPDPDTLARRTPPAETIQARIGEAGSAVVSLTRKATDDTLSPARNLFAAPAPRVPSVQPTLDLPDTLAELPGAAKAGLEPLTNTARRAVNLFLRDIGGATGAGKMGS